ncbi:hypothetical protein JCM15908A_10800 [Prevotella dentasini JCM 15908]
MEKCFLEILHNGEVMNETSLEMLKGGFGSSTDCPSLTSCGCYKGNAVACIGNKVKPEPVKPPTDTNGSTTNKP